MRIASYTAEVFAPENRYKFIHDWVSMGVITGAQPYKMAYIDRDRAAHVKKHVLKKKRITWESSTTLKSVQLAILGTVKCIFEESVPEKDKNKILAYRTGVDPIKVLRDHEDTQTLIKFDIRKYFDNIKFRHLDACWKTYANMTDSGSRLFSKYLLQNGGLQQGSVASPVVSNLVGYHFIDLPIKRWLQATYPDVICNYFRFCDNVVLLVKDKELPENFYKDFKAFVRDELYKSGFRTHMWDKIGRDNPVKNIHWLGAVFGKCLRYDRHRYDLLRGELFSLLKKPTAPFYSLNIPIAPLEATYGGYRGIRDAKINQVLRVYRGRVAHIRRLNEKQGLALSKLVAALEYLMERTIPDVQYKVDLLRTYKNHHETEEQFMQRILMLR